MDNSLVHTLEGYVEAIFKDIAPTYGRTRDLVRDKSRTLHELRNRGLRLLTIDFPAIRKHLDRCLDEGMYSPSGLYLCKAHPGGKVPRFCKDLYLQVFNPDGRLKAEPNVHAIADLRQLFEGFSKLKKLCKQEAIDAEVENFYSIEAELRNPSASWISDTLEESDTHDLHFVDGLSDRHHNVEWLPGLIEGGSTTSLSVRDLQTLQRVCDIVASTFGDFHLERDDERVTERPKHGPGRVSNLRKEQSKFDFSSWPRKLDHVFPYDYYAVNDLGLNTIVDNPSSPYLNREDMSKLIAVPKTQSGPRLICSEPNYHQWIQQLVRAQVEARIKTTPLRHCVSFGNQSPNRELALSSSADGYFCTVDLKSASDRLSCWTVERALRRNFSLLQRIHASRTRMMRNAINDRFPSIILKKCFTQGSACTFPMQTVIYSMISIASVIITDDVQPTSLNITRSARNVRVFGDDIIVPSNSLPKLLEILEFLQLKVNLSKTFSKGKFRESCGIDAYDGVDVTPARIKAFSSNPSHKDSISMIECSNNLFDRGLWNTATWLSSFVRKLSLPITGPYGSVGLRCFSGTSYSHLKKRFNSLLHREEYLCHTLSSKTKRVPTQSAYDLMDFLHKPQRSKYLEYLDPPIREVGVVDKAASVMKRGWRFLA